MASATTRPIETGLSELLAEAQASAAELVEAPPVAPEPVTAADAEGGGLPREQSEAAQPQAAPAFEPALLDRIPLGVLVYRHEGPHDALLYANRYFLELSGHDSLGALAAPAWTSCLPSRAPTLSHNPRPRNRSSIVTRDGSRHPVEGRLFTIPWGGTSALALILTNGEAEQRRRANAALLAAAQNEVRDLKAHVESFKKAEADMRVATREAQKVAASKAEFVAKVSHEIRTPLNAITGFAEVIMAERFGPIGNERYAEYLKDIHGAGMHLVSLLNDLLDLSKIETGQLDLSFANISLNDLTQQCVGIMQPQASRARIIIRTSLMPGLPQVVADERVAASDRSQSAVEFDQVHRSGRPGDRIDGVRRQRRSGAARPRHRRRHERERCRGGTRAVSSDGDVGKLGLGWTGLGLPLTKALAEANRAISASRVRPMPAP